MLGESDRKRKLHRLTCGETREMTPEFLIARALDEISSPFASRALKPLTCRLESSGGGRGSIGGV